MNMQQFTGWLMRLLDVLPWRRAKRSAWSQMQVRMTQPSQAGRFAFPDSKTIRRRKAKNTAPCPTLSEGPPAAHDPPAPSLPRAIPLFLPSGTPAGPLLALPASSADATPVSEQGDEPRPFQADPARRLAFARFLVQRGTLNEGFPRDALPAYYRDRASRE